MSKRPLGLWLLIITLALLALGGSAGAYGFLSDPTGAAMGMALVLDKLPVDSYFLPGLFLLLAFTVGPLLVIYVLLMRPAWPWLDRRWRAGGAYWGWTASLGIGPVLAGWLLLQAVLIGFDWPIQWFTAAINAAVLLFALMLSVRRACRM